LLKILTGIVTCGFIPKDKKGGSTSLHAVHLHKNLFFRCRSSRALVPRCYSMKNAEILEVTIIENIAGDIPRGEID